MDQELTCTIFHSPSSPVLTVLGIAKDKNDANASASNGFNMDNDHYEEILRVEEVVGESQMAVATLHELEIGYMHNGELQKAVWHLEKGVKI